MLHDLRPTYCPLNIKNTISDTMGPQFDSFHKSQLKAQIELRLVGTRKCIQDGAIAMMGNFYKLRSNSTIPFPYFCSS